MLNVKRANDGCRKGKLERDESDGREIHWCEDEIMHESDCSDIILQPGPASCLLWLSLGIAPLTPICFRQ